MYGRYMSMDLVGGDLFPAASEVGEGRVRLGHTSRRVFARTPSVTRVTPLFIFLGRGLSRVISSGFVVFTRVFGRRGSVLFALGLHIGIVAQQLKLIFIFIFPAH